MFYLSIRCAKVLKILQYTISTPQIHHYVCRGHTQQMAQQIARGLVGEVDGDADLQAVGIEGVVRH